MSQVFTSVVSCFFRAFHARRVFQGLLLCAIFSAGCVSMPRFHPPGAARSEADARRVCADIVAKRSPINSLRAVVEATVRSSKSESASFRYGIASKEPAKLRIDILPMEGAYTLGLIVIREAGATLIDTNNREFAEGRNADELLRRFLGLQGLSREVIVSLVAGTVPAETCGRAQLFEDSSGTATFFDAERHIVWEVHATTGEIQGVQILNKDNQRLEARAEVSSNSTAPREIALSIFDPVSASASMIVRKVNINVTVPDGLFEVSIPSGYRRND